MSAADRPHEFVLREYEARPGEVGLWEGLRPYRDERWLEPALVGDAPCLRARHYVGLMPFIHRPEGSDVEAPALLLVVPKGCATEDPVESAEGLRRFFEMAFLYDHAIPLPPAIPTGADLGRGSAFLKLIAERYAGELRELCHRDFRCDYRHHEAELRGRIRGRIAAGAHMRNSLRGRSHMVPCRWEEFTQDNWDNRVLLGAFRALERQANCIAPEAGRAIRQVFRPFSSWFSEVEDHRVGTRDLARMRLHRVSVHYRRARHWAELILRGMGRPVAGGGVPPFVIDANRAFETFVAYLVRTAVEGLDMPWRAAGQDTLPRGMLVGDQPRRPDVTVRSDRGFVAVGDAKYKDVLNWSVAPGTRLDDPALVARAAISPTDWNQLYVYMRLAGAPRGFFVVPYWDREGHALNPVVQPEFVLGPMDHGQEARVAVFGVNLMRGVAEIRSRFVEPFRKWIVAG